MPLFHPYKHFFLCACLGLAAAATSSHAQETVRFNRDVLPILSANCFQCHGPDAATRVAGIRFDLQEDLFGKTKGGLGLLTPGNPDASEIFKRITHADPDDRMPPAESKLHLSDQDIATLKTWIEQGAAWEGHWAFIAPQKPDLPQVSDPAWPRNGIDSFILAALDRAGIKPSAEADRETLIRRVSLDLTGLPPTPQELEAFLAATGDTAYEKVVDRLLASPHYGERMSFPWLDAARYSDTNGYQRDTLRIMWPWRDWVIKAFNDNMPYDQFAVEQLAGDLLPNATLEQKIATGFNRNHRINGEGGIIPEEYAVEYVADRVATTSTAFLGLTVGCARCHDHKFDPISHKEFYEFYAFFNQVPEQGKGGERGNDVPIVEVPTGEQTAQKKILTEKLAALEATLTSPNERLDTLQAAWEQQQSQQFASLDWQSIDFATIATQNGATLTKQPDQSLLASGPNPDHETYVLTFTAPRELGALKLEVLTDPSLPEAGPGRAPNGNVVLSSIEVERTPAATPGQPQPVAIVQALADYAQVDGGNFSIRNAIDADPATGWATNSPGKRENRVAVFTLDPAAAIAPGDQVTIRIKNESPHTQHAIGRFRLSQSPSRAIAQWTRQELGTWHYAGPIKSDEPGSKLLLLAFPPEEGYDAERTYADGQVKWIDKSEWSDGQVVRFDSTDKCVHYLHRTLRLEVPQALTLSLGSNDALKVWIDGQEKLSNNNGRDVAPDQDKLTVFLQEGDHEILLKIANYGNYAGYYFRLVDDEGQSLLAMMSLLSTPVDQRSPEARQRLATLFRERDPEWVTMQQNIATARTEIEVLNKSIITTMVMEDMVTPRDTYLFTRGVYDKPDTSEKLYPSVPTVLGEMDESLPTNRLGLAKWLVNPKNPLTARVRVNHYWQMYFGRGLVKTSEDFGTQGVAPTHPALLDWLATEFVGSGWDVKAMQKRIVMSATYRQLSRITPEHLEKDPANLLLARMPRVRLPAETVRDQALAASGLLTAQVGGPSVKPYQPGDLWSALTFQNMDEFDTNFYVQDTGPNLYRRGLYTFWKRTILPPHMQIFNAAGREMCTMRTENTNTPMQALAVMNDPTFVEAARFLGQRMILEGGARSADRVRYGFRLLLAHTPNPRKEQILLGALNDYQSHYFQRPEDAKKLLAVGDAKPAAGIPEPELAAYTSLASVMLNMDEALTRE